MSRHLLLGLALSSACIASACLGFGCDGAEARARIGFGRSHVTVRPSVVPVVRSAAAPTAALPLHDAVAERSAERAPAEEPARTGGIPAAPAPADAVAAPKPETPWCATGTVVGSGRGFCVIN